jgi:hypothetical protein
MAKNRVFVPVTTREYAELFGISLRTAQRRVKSHPGAVQVGKSKRWKIPLTASQYAEKKGVSQSTARRRGVSVPTLADFAKAKSVKLTPYQERAADNWTTLVAGGNPKRDVSGGAIVDRMSHASRKQAKEIESWSEWPDDLDYEGLEYEGDDGDSILHYHD